MNPDKVLEEILRSNEEILKELRGIRRELKPHPFPTAISFKQESNDMALLPADPGNTLVFTGTLTPAGATYPAGTTYTVVSSDPTVTPTVDATGLIVTIPLPTTVTVGETLTVSYTATGTTTEPGTISATITLTIGAPPVTATFPTGISFQQTE